ncbi:MAG: hypothetical protein H7Z38_15860 [Rubrivivax sp.]|nr:hypothetical protein [Pyrinomonadaceae bacterium]
MPNQQQTLSNETFTDDPMRVLEDAGASGFVLEDTETELRLVVLYASSQAVDMNGRPMQEIPLDLIELDSDGRALARAMVEASEIYTDEDGWLLEYRDADAMPSSDMALLVERLGESVVWDEFIGLPEGCCHACGGAGFVAMDCCDDGVKYELRGDCEGCDGTGQL